MLPNEDQCAIAEMARQFARERLKPFAEQWSREHRYPAEAIGEMAALGFFGMLVPEQWGGSDTGYLAYAMALEEIAAGDGCTIMSVHNSVGCVPILRFGNDQQKRDFLGPLALASRSAPLPSPNLRPAPMPAACAPAPGATAITTCSMEPSSSSRRASMPAR